MCSKYNVVVVVASTSPSWLEEGCAMKNKQKDFVFFFSP